MQDPPAVVHSERRRQKNNGAPHASQKSRIPAPPDIIGSQQLRRCGANSAVKQSCHQSRRRRTAPAPMKIERIDHIVLTVKSIERSVRFYEQLGMVHKEVKGRHSLHFADTKFNLHQLNNTFKPNAEKPTPGSVDLCLISETGLDGIIKHLRDAGVTIELGPIERNGALGPMSSVYVRDPDKNLIEISNYKN